MGSRNPNCSVSSGAQSVRVVLGPPASGVVSKLRRVHCMVVLNTTREMTMLACPPTKGL